MSFERLHKPESHHHQNNQNNQKKPFFLNPPQLKSKDENKGIQAKSAVRTQNDIDPKSHNEEEFKVYKEHRLTLYQREIDALQQEINALPVENEKERKQKEKEKAKKEKEKAKFEKKAIKFASQMTEKESWDADDYSEKRDKKFGEEDYSKTIDSKKEEVNEAITSTLNSITSSIKTSTDLINNLISDAESNSAKADKLLTKAESVLNEAKMTSKKIAATSTKSADDTRILNELEATINKMITLVDTIRKNRDGLLADKPTFLGVINNLGAQQTALDAFSKKVAEEDRVVNLIAFQEKELPALKKTIDESIAAAGATKPKTTLLDEESTTAKIDELESESKKALQDPKVAERTEKLTKDHGAEVNWPLEAKIKRDLKAWTDKDRFTMVVKTIRAASNSERIAAVVDRSVLDAINSSLSAVEGASVVSELLVGSQKWKNPTDNDFYNHFVVQGKSGLLKTNKQMNCWESILYAAHLSGHLKASWIKNFYTSAGVIPGVHYDADIAVAKLWAQLGFHFGLPKYNPGIGNIPTLGQLVFYVNPGDTIPAHVAVSVGNNEVISLWTEPYSINYIQRIPITSIGGTNIYYGDTPW